MRGTPIHVRVANLEHVLAGVERLEAFAAERKLPIPETSRLALYIDVVRAVKSGDVAHLGAPDVSGALLELRQLTAIVDGLSGNPSLAPAFRVLIDGHYSTVDAPTHDRARDKQFELFVAALFALGRLPTEIAEPDVIVTVHGKQLGVAAKRPRSPGGVKSAIQKGGRQVRKAAPRGFVAIDTTMYPIPDGRLITAILDNVDDVPRATAERLDSVVAANASVVQRRLMEEPERSGTLGLLFHLAVPFMIDSDDVGLTVAVGEAWLVLPAKLRLFSALASIVSCLGANATIMALRPPSLANAGARRTKPS